MAFPTIPTVAGSRILFTLNTAGGATKTFPNLSSLTKNAGDLLIAICVEYDGNSINSEFSAWGASFTEFTDQAGTSTMAIGAAYKISTGSETGTFTVTTADTSANDSVMILMSIPGARTGTAPEAGTMATGTAPDSGSLNPANWDTEDTLWISVGASGEDSTSGTYTGITTAPTNYGSQADSGITADVVGGVEAAVAFRQLNAASEDPGTWSMDTSNARGASLLIAVRPMPVPTGLGASPFSASAVNSKEVARTGTAIAPFVGSGADASTLNRSGIGQAPFVASGARPKEKSGAAVSEFVALDGTAGYPKIVDIKTGTQTSDSSTWTLDYPDGMQPGDLLLVLMGVDGAVTINSHPSLAAHSNHNAASSAACILIGKKVATGAESGTFNIGLTAAEQGTWVTMRITRWGGRIGTNFTNSDSNGGSVTFSATSTGTSTAPEPGGTTPFFNSGIVAAWRRAGYLTLGVADGGDTTFTAQPSSYERVAFLESGGADGAALGVAYGRKTSVTEFPGAFTIDASEEWGAGTLAIEPLMGPNNAISERVASGVAELTGGANEKAGTATSEFMGSGADAITISDTGTSISEFTASGVAEKSTASGTEYVKTGIGITAFVGSGVDATTFTESGLTQTGSTDFGGQEEPSASQTTLQHTLKVTQWASAGGTYPHIVAALVNTVATHQIRGAIYTDNAGQPETLVAATPVYQIPITSERWFPLAFSSPVTLPAGHYWIGVMGDSDDLKVRRSLDGPTRYDFLNDFSDGPPATFSVESSPPQTLLVYMQSGGMVASGDATHTVNRANTAVSELVASGADASTLTKIATAGSGFYLTTIAIAAQPDTQRFGRTDDSHISHRFVPNTDTDIVNVRSSMRQIGGVADLVRIEVRTDSSGSPSETVLGSGTLDLSGISTFTLFTVPVVANLTAGTTYHVVWSRTGAQSDAAFYRVATAPYPRGVPGLRVAVAGTFGAEQAQWVGYDFAGDGFVGSGVSEKIAGGGGNEYIKAGTGIAEFVGSGDATHTVNRANTAVSEFVASGADAITYAETGTCISVFTGSGADAITYTETGTCVSTFTGSGADAVTYTETGTGVAPFTGTADATWTTNRTGAAVAPFVASAADAITVTETGTGVIQDFIASGDQTVAWVKLGSATSAFVGSGADAFTATETGTTISIFAPSGADAVTYAETGTGITPFTGSGADAFTATETGTGIAPFTGAGARAKESTRTGATESPFTASGADVAEHAENGTGIAPFTASGTQTLSGGVEYTKAGTAITEFVAASPGDEIQANTGTAIAPFTGSGGDATTSSEAGAGILDATASGTRSVEHLRTGTAVAPFTASGADAFTATDSGTGILNATGDGVRAREMARIGTGTTPFVGSGADSVTFAEAGTGIVNDLIASGAGDQTYSKAGSCVSTFIADGTGTWTLDRAGTGIVNFTGGAFVVKQGEPTGTGKSEFVASGDANWTVTKQAEARAPFVGSASDVWEQSDSGTGVLGDTASGSRAVEHLRVGAATSAFSAEADARWELSRSGTGVLVAEASATPDYVINKSGFAVIGVVASGTSAGEGGGDGTAASGFTADGASSVTYAETGTAILNRTASGTASLTNQVSGTAISAFVTTGEDAVESAESGAGVGVGVAIGAGEWELDRSGTGILDGSGSGILEPGFEAKAGIAIMGLAGKGRSGKKKKKAHAVGGSTDGPHAEGEVRPNADQ